jgi:hypothetical protein
MQVERILAVAILQKISGKRESNTLVTYPEDRYNPPKGELIPDVIPHHMVRNERSNPPWEGPMAHQLVGRVKAYQGFDE